MADDLKANRRTVIDVWEYSGAVQKVTYVCGTEQAKYGLRIDVNDTLSVGFKDKGPGPFECFYTPSNPTSENNIEVPQELRDIAPTLAETMDRLMKSASNSLPAEGKNPSEILKDLGNPVLGYIRNNLVTSGQDFFDACNRKFEFYTPE